MGPGAQGRGAEEAHVASGTGPCHTHLLPLWPPLDCRQVPNCFPLRPLPKLFALPALPGTLFLPLGWLIIIL